MDLKIGYCNFKKKMTYIGKNNTLVYKTSHSIYSLMINILEKIIYGLVDTLEGVTLNVIWRDIEMENNSM